VSASPIIQWQCPPKTVLVAVDFSDASARALAIAGVVASAFGARLRALHAERFEPPPYFTIEQIARLEDERRMGQAAAADHLTRFAAGASACRVESIVVDEPPVDAILEAAVSADLIVVGTHGRHGPGRWWLGSVAERVVRAATIPVLVTRAADTPARDVFEHLALVQDGGDADAAARTCAGHLASIAGGNLIDGGPVTRCEANVMERASLVVVAGRSDRPSWGITDPVAKMLGACQRPVLFIPARGTRHMRKPHDC
jgi:nucleotide-binding universal stress UspA family protein